MQQETKFQEPKIIYSKVDPVLDRDLKLILDRVNMYKEQSNYCYFDYQKQLAEETFKNQKEIKQIIRFNSQLQNQLELLKNMDVHNPIAEVNNTIQLLKINNYLKSKKKFKENQEKIVQNNNKDMLDKRKKWNERQEHLQKLEIKNQKLARKKSLKRLKNLDPLSNVYRRTLEQKKQLLQLAQTTNSIEFHIEDPMSPKIKVPLKVQEIFKQPQKKPANLKEKLIDMRNEFQKRSQSVQIKQKYQQYKPPTICLNKEQLQQIEQENRILRSSQLESSVQNERRLSQTQQQIQTFKTQYNVPMRQFQDDVQSSFRLTFTPLNNQLKQILTK